MLQGFKHFVVCCYQLYEYLILDYMITTQYNLIFNSWYLNMVHTILCFCGHQL
jgi:hypothetical protein